MQTSTLQKNGYYAEFSSLVNGLFKRGLHHTGLGYIIRFREVHPVWEQSGYPFSRDGYPGHDQSKI
jgi:hypothetical protein